MFSPDPDVKIVTAYDSNLMSYSTPPLASPQPPPPRGKAWYTLFVYAHTCSIPGLLGIRKITNTYHTLGMYMNCTHLFHKNHRESGCKVAASPDNLLFAKVLLCVVSVVKAYYVQNRAATSSRV